MDGDGTGSNKKQGKYVIFKATYYAGRDEDCTVGRIGCILAQNFALQ